MRKIDQIPLSEFFELYKKPQYILGTTYTLSLAFFESVIYPLINRSALRHCLIIADKAGYQRALDEAPALQSAAQGYMVASAPTDGSFHSKVWLLADHESVALLIGSGNLTQSGFMDNAELFDVVEFSQKEPPPHDFLQDIINFVSGLKGLWSAPDARMVYCTQMLEDIVKHLTSFTGSATATSSTIRLLSTFGPPIIEQLPDGESVTTVRVAAPYFGGKLDGIRLFQARYPTAAFSIFPAIQDDAVDLPVKQLSKEMPKALVAALDLGKRKKRFAHLKLYGIETKGADAWIFCTSANCTKAALTGPNIEAGLLRRISGDELRSYFVADPDIVLPDKLRPLSKDERWHTLHLTASDVGSGVDVSLLSNSMRFSPLAKVVITTRSGSWISKIEITELFKTSPTAHLRWADFRGWKRQPNMAIVLELQALDKRGQPVSGACFVENRPLLSAEPVHRSAFRGALALLDEQAVPEYGDVAAIFTLVGSVFEGKLLRAQIAVSKIPVNQPAVAAEEEDSSRLPLWPPQAADHHIAISPATRHLGHLHWCQKVLQVFLKPTDSQQADVGSSPQVETDEDNGDETDREETAADQERLRKAAFHIWDEAKQTYDRLLDALEKLVPDEEQASNMWAASAFLLLATLAVRRVAARAEEETGQVASARYYISQLLAKLFDFRQQPEDYTRPKGHPYHYNLFPPLAEDMYGRFNLTVHVDLASVLCACLADGLVREGALNDPLVNRWMRLRRMAGDEFRFDESLENTCVSIWRRYLCEDGDESSEIRYRTAVQDLWKLGWDNHSGYRELKALIAFIKGSELPLEMAGWDISGLRRKRELGRAEILPVDPCVEFCPARGCPMANMKDPDTIVLRRMRPVVCRWCGTVLAPKPLYEAVNQQ